MSDVKNLSSNQSSIVINIAGFVGIQVDRFDPDSDMLTIGETTTGGIEKTPDGRVNMWGMNGVIPVTLNLSAGSEALAKIQRVVNLQQTTANRIGFIENVTMIVTTPQGTETFLNGVILTTSLGISIGNQKLKPVAIQMAFGDIIR